MKWIFASLLLANVALFLWGTWYRAPLVGEVIPAPRPPVAQEKLKLLTEPGARLTLRSQAASAPRTSDGGPAVSGCYQLGPFATLERVRAAGAKLDGWGVSYTRVAEFETRDPAYRVYLPPFPSREAAERRLRELSRLGISDYAVIEQEEGMENAISLGLFNVEQNARARIEQLARRGVRASMQPVPNVLTVYWLALPSGSVDGRIGGIELERFGQEEWGAANITLRAVPCARAAEHVAPEVTRPVDRR